MELNLEFKSAKELVGKVVRRTAPSTNGDYSFIMQPVLIKEVQTDRVIVKSLEGALVSLMFPDYDDDNWVEANHGVKSVQVAELWSKIRELSGS
jgi:hypothetical protein